MCLSFDFVVSPSLIYPPENSLNLLSQTSIKITTINNKEQLERIWREDKILTLVADVCSLSNCCCCFFANLTYNKNHIDHIDLSFLSSISFFYQPSHLLVSSFPFKHISNIIKHLKQNQNHQKDTLNRAAKALYLDWTETTASLSMIACNLLSSSLD